MIIKKAAFLFPGQGSLRSGLCLDLQVDFPVSRLVLEVIDDAVGARVSKALTNGTDAELMRTELTQPALLAHSIASLAALRSEVYGRDLAEKMTIQSNAFSSTKEEIGGHLVSCVMGHSVGEYAALVAASSLPLASAAKILRLRASSMQKAADSYSLNRTSNKLGMVALLLAPSVSPLQATADLISDCCLQAEKRHGGIANIAGINSPQQIVLSGELPTIERAISLFNEKSTLIKRTVPLSVSAPFHSLIMSSAAEDIKNASLSEGSKSDGILSDDKVFRQASEAFQQLSAPSCSFISNVTAAEVQAAGEIKSSLFESMTKPVLWEKSLHAAKNLFGVDNFLAFGSATSLAGLVKQTLGTKKQSLWTIGTSSEVKDFVSFLNKRNET
jgi:[acyl-carrier-protein] S-malonyltransferase